MSNVIAIRDADVGDRILVPYSEMPDEQKALLKAACNSAQLNDAQFALLVEVARRSGLDPFRRHLYGLFFDGKFTLVTGIDGFRAVARRNGLAGIDDATHAYDDEKDKAHNYPVSSTVTVYRWAPNGEKEKYTATARWREYARYTRDKKTGDSILQSNWRTKPHIMLDKCAEALALRKAFTESLGGIYERAEFGEADGDAVARSVNAPRKLADIIAQPVIAKRPEGAEPIDVEFSEQRDEEPPPGEGYIPEEPA